MKEYKSKTQFSKHLGEMIKTRECKTFFYFNRYIPITKEDLKSKRYLGNTGFKNKWFAQPHSLN